jgi:protein-L-isoaspartate(D-aspartate) O-methyltransferase
LRATNKVLEIGTGSGSQAAVLSRLVQHVYTIEIVGSLSRRAAVTLQRLGYRNVHARSGDGFQGWPQSAPFDKIIVTCSPENVPQPLIEQLKEGGTMIIPVGQRYQQTRYLFQKVDGKLVAETIEPTMFVPMTGAAEDQRRVKPDPAKPSLVNGGFEEPLPTRNEPAGWYYVRLAQRLNRPDAPEGQACLVLSNSTPGRQAQALQALGVDGERVAELEVDFWVRTQDVKAGQSPDQLPRFLVTYYDSERVPIGQAVVGPWSGNQPWTKQHARMVVPHSARMGVVMLCLLGGTGEIDFDGLELRPGRPSGGPEVPPPVAKASSRR